MTNAPFRRRVVVTGVGAVTPLGIGSEVLLTEWEAGTCAIRDGVARCWSYDPHDHFGRRETNRYDRFTQLAIVAADEAFRMANWDDRLPVAPRRIASIVGSGAGGVHAALEAAKVLDEEGAAFIPSPTIPRIMINAPAGVLALRFGLRGPSLGVVSACASGADALCVAARMIRYGEVDAALAGGSEAQIAALTLAGFAVMEALSPTGRSLPFDARRDGFVMGEGAGIMVLEALEVATHRRATVLGEILGFAASNDAFHLVAPDPSGAGGAEAISAALEDADVSPERISYINAHGTGTQLNDRSETFAVKRALGRWAAGVPISSLKSAIGHLIGAAGTVEAIATIMALRQRIAPPTLNLEVPDPDLDLDYVPQCSRALRDTHDGPPVGISQSFGFGGHNTVMVFAVDA
jgi:3-oxoacyl-[acyl-carrier-protein] synthase II